MAPKAADKAKAQAKAKAIEDKTFGLKNKNKSKAVQNYVKNLQQSAQPNQKQQRLAEPTAKDKKKAEEERKKELDALFAVAIKQPKVPPGVDPKSIVCEFFRHGQCTKGFKCKFSHDMSVERKGGKIDLFTDQRSLGEGGEEGEKEGMDDWDQETLEKVVNEKHGREGQANNPTQIICKFFLEAVEKKQYGWFWKCPNGGDCKYRHALPPGYVLKSQMKAMLEEEAKNVRDVAEVIEEERAKVEAKTPINEVVFREWRAKKIEDRKKKATAQEEDRKKKGIMTGREIFMQEGFSYTDDASAADDYVREDDEEQRINEMFAQAKANADRARLAAAAEPALEPVPEAGPSGSSGAGPSAAATHLHHLADEDADLFDDDDDDEEDMDEEDLEALEEDLKAKAAVSRGNG